MLSFLVGVILAGALAFGFEALFGTTPYTLLSAAAELPQFSWLPVVMDGVSYFGLSLLAELLLYKDKRYRRRAGWGSVLVLVMWLLRGLG